MKMVSSLFLVLVIIAFPHVARSGTSPVIVGAYPVPASEMMDQVIAWLHGSGFRISRERSDMEKYALECARGGERILVLIRPDSPLASVAQVSGLTGGAGADSVAAGLKSSLDAYVRNLRSDEPAAPLKIPDALRPREKTVFCLSASVGGRQVEFSGFAVDRRGGIVTTAHDLDGIGEISVRLENGEKIAGKVVRRDPLADLTLIKLDKCLPDTVPALKGRRRLKMGEKIFSMVCPEHKHGNVRMGIVDEPPAIVNGQILWQVNMEVAPGDSGSPVFDSNGRLAGVVKGRFRGGWSRGFLIPVGTLWEFLGLEGK